MPWGSFPRVSSEHGHRPHPALLLLQVSRRRPGCARTLLCGTPCTLTLFSCTLVSSSAGHFLGHVLESNFGRRPKPSGTALRRSPFVMELLLWRPALSQKCPLLVPACGHRTATQQDYDQAARAIRPYTKPEGSERERGSEKRMALEDQVLPGSAAMPGHSSSPPLHTAIVPAAPKRS